MRSASTFMSFTISALSSSSSPACGLTALISSRAPCRVCASRVRAREFSRTSFSLAAAARYRS